MEHALGTTDILLYEYNIKFLVTCEHKITTVCILFMAQHLFSHSFIHLLLNITLLSQNESIHFKDVETKIEKG